MQYLVIIFCSLFSLSSVYAHEEKPEYLKAPKNELSFMCAQKDNKAKPYNIFMVSLYYKNTGLPFKEVYTAENLSNQNGNLVYSIRVFQAPYKYAEVIYPIYDKIKNCDKAPLKVEAKSDGLTEIYFECAADGDAGFASLKTSPLTLLLEGSIFFPEGNREGLQYPFVEDTEIPVTCHPR